MGRHILTVTFVVCAFAQLAIGNDQALSNKSRSFAPSIQGKAPIHQIVGALERAMQQNDLEQLLSLFISDINSNELSQLPVDAVAQFQERLNDNRNLALTTESNTPGWLLTGYANFGLLVDSIVIIGDVATAYLHATWAYAQNKGNLPRDFVVSLSRDKQCWRFRSAAEILGVIDAYTEGEADFNDPNVRNLGATTTSAARSTTGYYEAVNSSRMINELPFWESQQVGRFNRIASRTKIYEDIPVNAFGCATQISSFVFISPGDFATDQIAVSDECWRRIVALDDSQQYLIGMGKLGSGANRDDFAAPQGLEYMSGGFLYIAEDYNNRIKLLSLHQSSDDPIRFSRIIQLPEFNRPMDLDVTLPDQYGQRTVVVANSGGNNIVVFDDRDVSGPWHVKVHTWVEFVGTISQPTSVAFGRDPQTSQKTFAAYFIDSDKRRIVRINNVYTPPSQGVYYADFPDPHTNLSSIAVDNKGEVYAVDKGLGKIYKFTSDLQLIATHGFQGTGDKEYLHPTSISFTQGIDANGNMLSGLGEVALAEEWTDETGIRRLVAGTEIFNSTINFTPKLATGTPARIKGSYFITGYSNAKEELVSPTGVVLETHSHLMAASGFRTYDFSLNPAWPSGLYTIWITAQSIYTNSNTDRVTLTVNVDQSLTNERPVVNNIWFPSGDSCFIRGEITRIAGGATDADGQVVEYIWSVYPPNTGNFLFADGNEIEFYTDEEPGKDVGAYIQLKVRDNYGEESTPLYQLNFLPLIKYWPYDCICTWQPGDPDFNHIITITDIVYIINHIMSGGPPPIPVVQSGDADCNSILTISDSVYLINYMFAGGPPIQCDCSDY